MRDWSLTQTSGPSIEPVTTAEAKHHSRVDAGADDAYVAGLIKAARERVEQITGRQLITATYELRMHGFYNPILLPRPPLQDVTKIEYVDTGGSTQTVSAGIYDVDSHSNPARVHLAYAQSWPSYRSVPNAVTVTYDAGYGDAASDVPSELRHAIKMLVGHWYENREQTIAGTIARPVPMGVPEVCRGYSVTNYGWAYPGGN